MEDHVLVRRELDGTLDPEAYAIDIGDRVEQAFGSVARRHLARRGEFQGRFDPRISL